MPGAASDYLTIKEVAVMLKVKPVTVYKLLSLSMIPGVKVSGCWRFNKSSIHDWIDNECVYRVERAM